MMSGYLNRDDANDEATRVDSEGRRWLRTGDIGKVDSDGNLYIVDRKKDMIISGGQNVYPADIEAVLATHENIDDVAVIGVRSERWGETPCAFVALKPNTTTNEQEIIDFCRTRLARFKVPKTVVFGELPKTSTGKVQKYVLREHAKALAT